MDLKIRIRSYLTNLTLFKITLTTTMQRPHQGRQAKIGRKQSKMNGSFYREIYLDLYMLEFMRTGLIC
uniref:Uncharacterized protein n=1 Tax=Aegilops tauschii subsp. strangulata TaxID=200361 RepID=A0A453EIU7_AEGTS